MKNKKKKGFTLIELIAVIAILAILGAILVPNILAYRKKAEKSNIQSSAKTLLNAIDSYNSDKDTSDSCIGDTNATGASKDIANYPGSITLTNGITSLSVEGIISSDKIPTCLKTSAQVGDVGSLERVAGGNFTVDNVNGQNSSITVK